MSTSELDQQIHDPERLRVVATLAALPHGDALALTRLQRRLGLTPGSLLTRLRELAHAGFRVHGWKQGWNLGAKEDTLEKLKERIDGLGHDRPIVIVGWSLGGLFGREYARYHPEQVKAVITLGSPFSGDPRQNNVWQLYERVAKHPVDKPPIPRITDKPPVPHLAIWSPRDGLIAPRAARGLDHERDDAAEVSCHHMAFGVSKRAARDVVREIDRFLKRHT